MRARALTIPALLIPLVTFAAGACRQPAASSSPADTQSPAPLPAPSVATPVAPSASSGEPSGTEQTGDGGVADASDAPTEFDAGPASPILIGDAGETLPQTEETPAVESAFFRQLGPALWSAIIQDEAELVLPWFFPVEAYREVKAIAKPERDWETRLVRLFKRDIHGYRMQLGEYRHEMKFVRIEVPMERAKWMKPHSEGNKVGYWRVLRSHLVYLDREDHERRLEITSMISWRGEWYVVHLNGFK